MLLLDFCQYLQYLHSDFITIFKILLPSIMIHISFVPNLLMNFDCYCCRWFFPFIGHMGIATSAGVIRDFAGPYFVGEGHMAFGKPTRYIIMDPALAAGGPAGWDRAVAEASEIYKHRIHNLFCDNCHSHVATALDQMQYDSRNDWNMVKLALLMFIKGRYVG